MQKLNGKTLDIVNTNIDKLKEIFPDVFSEGKIDFEALKSNLGEFIDKENERYSFSWNGKEKAKKIALIPSTGTLRPCKDESKHWDETGNIYIKGDNLDVLKLLQKSYFEKIKMIYIDPPYNTGNDFIYKDDFSDSNLNYKKLTKQITEDNITLTTNSDQNGRYHSNWLNLMYPRLKLARNLLKNDGAIFISIDENEIHNLRKLCDEIFGEDNFLTQFGIKLRHENRILKGDKDFHEVYEYCLAYRKSSDFKPNKRIEDNTSIDNYIYTIEIMGEPEEELTLDGKIVQVYSPDSYEVIKHSNPSTDYFQKISIRGSLKDGNSSGRFFMKHLDGIPEKYAYLYKVPDMGNDKYDFRFFMKQPSPDHANGIYFQGVPLDRQDTKEVPYPNFYDYVDIFNNVGYEGEVAFRNGKKPIKFLQQMMTIAGLNREENKNEIVLDFFSGSGSTGHGVMDLNAQDNGNRKFILVQLPENTEANSEAYKLGLKTICDIGIERLKRSGEKICQEHKKDLFNIQDEHVLDTGLKVFSLDSSNIKAWDSEYAKDNIQQSLLDSISNIKEDRTELDLLFELLLKQGLDLTTSIMEIKVNDKVIYNIGAGALYVSLSANITVDVAEKIIEENKVYNSPRVTVIFKDNGFKMM